MDVHTRRTSSEPTANRRRSLHGALLAACLLGGGWSTSGAAAPSALHDDQSDLTAPELVTGDYTLEVADLMRGDEQSPEARDEPGKLPYLYLTPRVAIILENIFGAEAAEAETDSAAAAPTQDEDEASSTSPVAGNAERPLAPESPSFDSSAILPRFQRQMYRTDI